MTPKEKAEELVNKYRDTIMSFLSDNMKDMNAKKCALIAVDEIHMALYEYLKDTDELQNADREFDFWNKVEEEIEKL